MKVLTKYPKQKLTLILLSSFSIVFNLAMAKDDAKTKQGIQQHNNHSKTEMAVDKKQKQFRGVFYGYLPCKDCDGVQTTLSLKNKNNYLLVTQPAKASGREFFEKGKYIWDDETRTVTLTSRKDSSVRKYHIQDAKTLFTLNEKGVPVKGKKGKYALTKRDLTEKRQSHGSH